MLVNLFDVKYYTPQVYNISGCYELITVGLILRLDQYHHGFRQAKIVIIIGLES